jgi:hypothetical protein
MITATHSLHLIASRGPCTRRDKVCATRVICSYQQIPFSNDLVANSGDGVVWCTTATLRLSLSPEYVQGVRTYCQTFVAQFVRDFKQRGHTACTNGWLGINSKMSKTTVVGLVHATIRNISGNTNFRLLIGRINVHPYVRSRRMDPFPNVLNERMTEPSFPYMAYVRPFKTYVLAA